MRSPPRIAAFAVWALVGAASTLATAVVPSRASAQLQTDAAAPPTTPHDETTRYEWSPRWRRFSTADYLLTAGAAGVALASQLLSPLTPHRSGGMLFDESVRDALRPDSRTERQLWRDMSDIFLSLAVAYPYLVDALIDAAWAHDSPDVARQMALIDTETFAITAALQGIATFVSGRERPYVRTCGGETPADSADCTSTDRFRSFFSGHTSLTFTAATLTCSHHAHFALYGGALDPAACVTGLALAAATGMFRVMADMHYLTDALTGAAIGTFSGLFFPWLLHYRNGSGEASPSTAHVMLVPVGLGAGLAGDF